MCYNGDKYIIGFRNNRVNIVDMTDIYIFFLIRKAHDVKNNKMPLSTSLAFPLPWPQDQWENSTATIFTRN